MQSLCVAWTTTECLLGKGVRLRDVSVSGVLAIYYNNIALDIVYDKCNNEMSM